MALLLQIISSVLLVFLILLFARFVVDWVMVLARSWRPQGLVAAGLEVVYATTDPPLKAVRKVKGITDVARRERITQDN